MNQGNAPPRSALNPLGAVSANATATVDVTQGVPRSTASGLPSQHQQRRSALLQGGTGAKPILTVVCAADGS